MKDSTKAKIIAKKLGVWAACLSAPLTGLGVLTYRSIAYDENFSKLLLPMASFLTVAVGLIAHEKCKQLEGNWKLSSQENFYGFSRPYPLDEQYPDMLWEVDDVNGQDLRPWMTRNEFEEYQKRVLSLELPEIKEEESE